MPRYGMAIDKRTCVACAACVVSCKVENQVAPGRSRDRVTERVTGVFPTLTYEAFSERCNQCSEAPCVTCCPTGASHYADGGIVLVDENKCTGCKACIASCPYDARFINDRGNAEKCTFCIERIREGRDPACVATCPSRAMIFGGLTRVLASRRHHVLKPEAGTQPNVFYLE